MKALKIIKHRLLFSGLFLFAVALSFNSCYYDNKDDLYGYVGNGGCDTTNVTYSATVSTILDTHCRVCHNAADRQGNISLATYNDVKNYANSGKLYGSIAHLSGYSKMPSSSQKIPACQIIEIKTWVDAGAPNN